MASMAATSIMGLRYSENLCETKLKKNVGRAKKVLKVKCYCSPMIRKENMLRRNLSVVANSSGAMINGKRLNVIHVGDDPYVGKKIRNTDGCMLGKFVEERFVYRQTFVIRSYEVGPDKTATMETLMNLLQETALNYVSSSGLAGNGFGVTREMSLRKLIWVMARIHIQVEKYSCWGDVVEIDTWLDAAGRNAMRGDWIIRDCNTRKIITRATSTWVLMNRETRRLCRIPDQVREELQPLFLNRLAIAAAAQNHEEKIDKLTDETAGRIRSGLAPRWSDMDANLHVNNVKYLEWILESLPMNVLEHYNLTSIMLEYRQECRQSDRLESLTSMKAKVNEKSTNNSRDVMSTHLLRMDDDKTEITRARLEWRFKEY